MLTWNHLGNTSTNLCFSTSFSAWRHSPVVFIIRAVTCAEVTDPCHGAPLEGIQRFPNRGDRWYVESSLFTPKRSWKLPLKIALFFQKTTPTNRKHHPNHPLQTSNLCLVWIAVGSWTSVFHVTSSYGCQLPPSSHHPKKWLTRGFSPHQNLVKWSSTHSNLKSQSQSQAFTLLLSLTRNADGSSSVCHPIPWERSKVKASYRQHQLHHKPPNRINFPLHMTTSWIKSRNAKGQDTWSRW